MSRILSCYATANLKKNIKKILTANSVDGFKNVFCVNCTYVFNFTLGRDVEKKKKQNAKRDATKVALEAVNI